MFCYFTSGFETSDDGGGVVAFWICKVFKVEGGLDVGVFRGEVQLPFRSWTGDVGRHTEGIDGSVITQARGVVAEGNLVAVHHYICRFIWWEVGPAEKNAGIGVHGSLVGRDGAVEFPDDDTFGVVQEVVAYARDVLDNWDVQSLKLDSWTNA